MQRLMAIVFVCAAVYARAQDPHFSQFFFTSQLLNPAETGNFEGSYAFSANQKTQWKSVTRPYQTIAAGAQANEILESFPHLAAGLQLISDVAGDSRLTTVSVIAGGSYSFLLDDEGRQQLYTGLQLGISQYSINYDALSFDRQFNGAVYNPSLPNGEAFGRESRWYSNLNFGMLYHWRQGFNHSFSAGFALHNLTAPDQSFFNDTGVDLQPRFSLYATGTAAISETFDVLPSLRWQQQSAYHETIAGAALRYVLLRERAMYRSVFAGYYGRMNDSGIAMAGMEFDAWRVALSYDINVSSLEAASRNKGGFELSLRYILRKAENGLLYQHKYCPVYL